MVESTCRTPGPASGRPRHLRESWIILTQTPATQDPSGEYEPDSSEPQPPGSLAALIGRVLAEMDALQFASFSKDDALDLGLLLVELGRQRSLPIAVDITKGEQVLYERGLTQVHDTADARRLRLLEVREGIPDLLWVVLVGGGVITVSFTYLFGLKSNVAHALMVAALTLVICGILFTVAEFNNPFSGVVEIRPDAFREVLGSFGGT